MLKGKQKSWVPWHKGLRAHLLFCCRGQITEGLPGEAGTTSGNNKNLKSPEACECGQVGEQLRGSHLVCARKSKGRGLELGGEGSQRGATECKAQ